MKNVTEEVWKVLDNSPCLRRDLSRSLINARALAKYILKEQKIDTTKLMFKAFELTGAYQGFLNPFVLHQKYGNQAPKMMAEVVSELEQNYNKKKDQILTTLEAAKKGINHRDIFYIKSPEGKEEIRVGCSELERKVDIGNNGKKKENNN